MKNFLDIPDLPHDAFQPIKIGLSSKMSLHKGGGSQTSYTSAYPEWAEPQVKDLFERGNLASLQPYQPYELGGSYQTQYGVPGSGPSGYSTDATEYERQQNLGVESDAYKALQASGQLIQQKSGYTGPDEALRARLATPEGLEAYVNEQTIGRGVMAGQTPLETASYARAAGLNTPNMFQDTYSGYTPGSSQYEAERQRYEDQQAWLGGLTDAQAQDIAFGSTTPDAGFTQQDLLNDLEILKISEGVLNPGQVGYEGARALHDRLTEAQVQDVRDRYSREGANYIESYLPGMATRGEGALGTAMDRVRSDVSGREFGSYTDPDTGEVVTDQGNRYDFGYQAPGAITQADIDEIDAMPGLSDEQRAARKAQLGSAVSYYEAGEDAGGYTGPGAITQADIDEVNAMPGLTAEQKEARIAQLGGAANYYAAGELGDTAKYSATGNETAIGAFTPEQIQALTDAGYDPTDIALQDADAGYTARQMVGGEFDADAATKYMDPYQQGITDIALESAQAEDLKYQNVLAAQAVQAGAFGGDREAILRAENARNQAKLLSDIRTQGSQKAYESAQAQFEADRAARMQAQQLTEGFRQKAAELDKSAIEFDETSDQTAARIGLEGYAKEQAAKQTEQQLLSDAWKANQAAAQVAGAQGIDAYAKEQQAKQTQQQLTTDSWKANQAAAQAAATGQLDADKLSESSGQFAATNALNRAKTENELFVSQAQLEMASSKLSMEQIQLANKLGGQQRGFTQRQLDLLQNESFAGQGYDQQQAAWLGALFSGSLMPNTGQTANSGESGINTLLGAAGTIGSLVT